MAQGFTLAQLQAMGATPSPAPPTNQGLTLSQLQALGATPNPPVVPPTMGDNINSDIQDAGAKVEADVTNTSQNPLLSGLEAGSDAASAIGNVTADVVPGGKAALQALGKIVGAAISSSGNVGGTLADASEAIGLMTPAERARYDANNAEFAGSKVGTAVEQLAEGTGAASNIAGTILGAGQGANIADSAVGKIQDVGTAVKNAVVQPAKQTADVIANQVKAALPPATPEEALAQVEQDWTRPVEMPGPRFNKLQDVVAQNPNLDIPNFLATHDIAPYDHIDEQYYSTDSVANKLRSTAGQLSKTILRPSLQMADYSTPPTPVSQITNSATENVLHTPEVTADDQEAATRIVQEKAAALQRKYPNGMSLTDMHDEKINYQANGGYKPTASAADNLGAVANRVIGNTLASMVEEKAPDNLPVGEFNQSLAQYYKAADYLDALDGKKAPVSPITQAVRYGARALGATIGAHIPGGSLVSDFIGYQVAKYAELQLENMTGPMRAMYLKNLEITNPAAFAQVGEYLKNAQAGNPATPQLPPATNETPIPMGPDSTPQPVAYDANRSNPPGRNPDTGQMKRVYTSSGTPVKKP